MNIVGKWERTTNIECGRRYPERIEFKVNGIYYAGSSSNAKFHPIWDAGSFHLAGESISMSTSNDAVINYKVTINGNKLGFEDADGCIIEYKKN